MLVFVKQKIIGAVYEVPGSIFYLTKNGADGRDRTCDLLVTNELLYQLSYIGTTFIITHFLLLAYRMWYN